MAKKRLRQGTKFLKDEDRRLSREDSFRVLFETGHAFLEAEENPLSGADLQALWEQHQHYILEEWISDHPGTRPWAFWKWDAPGKRRQVITNPNALIDGMPLRIYKPVPDGALESEHEFLKRHDLLTAGEQ